MFHIFPNQGGESGDNRKPGTAQTSAEVTSAKAYFESGEALAALKSAGIGMVRLCATEPVEYTTKPIVFTVWRRSFQNDVYGWVLDELK